MSSTSEPIGLAADADPVAAKKWHDAKVIALVLDVIAAGIFVVFGVFACKRHAWAFIAGMALYGIDSLLTLVAQYWLGVAFHAWVLFSLFVGMKAAFQINRANRNAGV